MRIGTTTVPPPRILRRRTVGQAAATPGPLSRCWRSEIRCALSGRSDSTAISSRRLGTASSSRLACRRHHADVRDMDDDAWVCSAGHLVNTTMTMTVRRTRRDGTTWLQRRCRTCWRASCRAASRRYYDRMAEAQGRTVDRPTTCRWCSRVLTPDGSAGRPAALCSPQCRRGCYNDARIASRLAEVNAALGRSVRGGLTGA